MADQHNLPVTGASDASSPFGPERTPYDAIGGDERVRALIETFYRHMDEAPLFAEVRALHPSDLAESREKLYEFLSGWLGGPPLYVEKRGHPRLRARHQPFPIGERERDQWLACMGRALDECGVGGDLRTFLDARFAQVANFVRNQ